MDNEQLHRQILERLSRIETNGEAMLAEARRTNGRVTKSEDEINAIKTVIEVDRLQSLNMHRQNATDISELKAHNAEQKTTVGKWTNWFLERLFTGVLYALIAVAAAVGILNLPK